MAPIRWDNWRARLGPSADVGGGVIEDGRIYAAYGDYRIRFGNFAMSRRCSSLSAIYFDRVSYSGSRLGPQP